MEQKTASMALSAIIFLSILAGGYFFAASGITLKMMLTVNAMPLLKAMFSINFALFVVMGGTATAGILLMAKTQGFMNALIFSEISYIAGICVSALIFGLLDFIIALGFGTIGIYFTATMLSAKEAELKKWILPRAGAASAGKIVIFIAAGLFISMVLTTAPNQAYYEDNFVTDLLSITLGDSATLRDSLNAPLADTVVQTQQETLATLTKTQQYAALGQKNDADVLGFIAVTESLEAQMKTKQYRDELLLQMSEKSDSVDFGESLMTQMPIIKAGAKYSWLLYALEGLLLVLFIGGMLTKNIAGLIYWALERFFIKGTDSPVIHLPPADEKEKEPA